MLKNLFTSLNYPSHFTITSYHVNLRRNKFIFDNCIVLKNRYLPSKFLCHTSAKQPSDLDEENDVQNKIIYNSILNNKSFLERKKEAKLTKKLAQSFVKQTIPVSLKYILENESSEPPKEELKVVEKNYLLNLPYTVKAVDENVFMSKDDQESSSENLSDSPDDYIVDC